MITVSFAANTDGILHLNDLNTAALAKYGKIAEATKSFAEKVAPTNEQCMHLTLFFFFKLLVIVLVFTLLYWFLDVQLAEQLKMIDKIMEYIPALEAKVSQLDEIVSRLGMKPSISMLFRFPFFTLIYFRLFSRRKV